MLRIPLAILLDVRYGTMHPSYSPLPSRNIGCEIFRICFISSFDCANISWDVITNRLDDFGPCLVRQIIVSHLLSVSHPRVPIAHTLHPIGPSTCSDMTSDASPHIFVSVV